VTCLVEKAFQDTSCLNWQRPWNADGSFQDHCITHTHTHIHREVDKRNQFSFVCTSFNIYLQCFDAVIPSVLWRCWLGGRKGIRPVKKLSGGLLAWLSVWSEVQTCILPSWCHCHSLSLALVKSRLVLPFWYRLTWVVPEKGTLNGWVCKDDCGDATVVLTHTSVKLLPNGIENHACFGFSATIIWIRDIFTERGKSSTTVVYLFFKFFFVCDTQVIYLFIYYNRQRTRRWLTCHTAMSQCLHKRNQ